MNEILHKGGLFFVYQTNNIPFNHHRISSTILFYGILSIITDLGEIGDNHIDYFLSTFIDNNAIIND